MNSLDLDDDDLRRRFDALAARAALPVLDPIADLRRARAARRRRRATQIGGGLVAAAAVTALVIGNLAGGDTDAREHIANDPTPTTTATEKPDSPFTIARSTPDGATFGEEVVQLLDRTDVNADAITSYATYALGETSMVSFDYPWSTDVDLTVKAGVSREAVEWEGFTDISSYSVGDGVGEQGSFGGGALRGYLYEQPDGGVVVVEVSGPAVQSPPAEIIDSLLTELDVPTSTLTSAQAWQDTMFVIGLDVQVRGELEIRPAMLMTDVPFVQADVVQGKRKTGRIEWQAQTLAAGVPDCPPGFERCGTMRIGGETFLAKYVSGGERAGWLYLERDHGDVRAQVILQPHEAEWSLPLEAAAELLLDGRWSSFDPGSSVPYPAQ